MKQALPSVASHERGAAAGVGADPRVDVPALDPGARALGTAARARPTTPVERVEPGTEVTFDTVSHEGILEDQGRDPQAFFAAYDVEHVLLDAVAIAATDASTHPRTFGVDGPHVVTAAGRTWPARDRATCSP